MNIKEKLRLFGIWVIRSISPGLKNKNTQRLGIMILGLGLMFGVSQASALRRAFLGMTGGATMDQRQTVPVKNTLANSTAPAVAIQTDETEPVSGESNAGPTNIVDLIADSETIISGMVKEVTDGFENGVPYTQVTLQVSETLRGQVGDEYTFRQFGLATPRKLENGKTYLSTTPAGWSKYEVGEDTMLFLYQHASQTGLQTTVGLGQGKVVFQGGNAVSQDGNEGMFTDVVVDAKLLNDKDRRLLATTKGEVNADGFKSFVRRAVKGNWIAGGKM